jgi:hypothetical protein
VSSPGDPDSVTSTGPGARLASVPTSRLHDHRDPWLRMGPSVGMTFPLAGQPGHGSTAFVRRQPVRIVDGRAEGGYTDVFEFICPGCGDNPHVDYSDIPSRLQWLRGPRTLQAALEVYDKHLEPFPGSNGSSASSLGSPRAAGAVSRRDHGWRRADPGRSPARGPDRRHHSRVVRRPAMARAGRAASR